MKPLISVISVNYNGYWLTCAMVESLRRHVTAPLEIIVVDNGSARDEAAMLRERVMFDSHMYLFFKLFLFLMA